LFTFPSVLCRVPSPPGSIKHVYVDFLERVVCPHRIQLQGLEWGIGAAYTFMLLPLGPILKAKVVVKNLLLIAKKQTNGVSVLIGWIRGFLFLRKFYFTCLKFTMYCSSSALHLWGGVHIWHQFHWVCWKSISSTGPAYVLGDTYLLLNCSMCLLYTRRFSDVSSTGSTYSVC